MNFLIQTFFIIRNNIRKIVLHIISLRATPKPGIHILNGHFLSTDNDASPDIFRKLLKKLNNKGIEFINFDIATELISKNKLVTDKYLVAFSFDDGFEECYTKIKPVLDEFKIKTGFFINPGFIDGGEEYQKNFQNKIVKTHKPPMTWEQVETLKNEGHIIGAHTIDHTGLDSSDEKMLEHQIGDCKYILEEKLNYKCDYFAYPFGRIEHISQKGVEIATKYYPFVFSQDNYKKYYSFDNKVINRRHFECDWYYKHVIYFLKAKK